MVTVVRRCAVTTTAPPGPRACNCANRAGHRRAAIRHNPGA